MQTTGDSVQSRMQHQNQGEADEKFNKWLSNRLIDWAKMMKWKFATAIPTLSDFSHVPTLVSYFLPLKNFTDLTVSNISNYSGRIIG